MCLVCTNGMWPGWDVKIIDRGLHRGKHGGLERHQEVQFFNWYDEGDNTRYKCEGIYFMKGPISK
jgi:hypothetical protein